VLARDPARRAFDVHADAQRAARSLRLLLANPTPSNSLLDGKLEHLPVFVRIATNYSVSKHHSQ